MGACCDTERKESAPANPQAGDRHPATSEADPKSQNRRPQTEPAPTQPTMTTARTLKAMKSQRFPKSSGASTPAKLKSPVESSANSTHWTAAPGYPVQLIKTDILGYYRLLEEYGRDGDEVVHNAICVRTGRACIVKVLPKARKSRLLEEAAALARLDHPAIVKVIDLLEDKDHVYLVKSHYTNISLASYFQGARAGDETAAARVMQQLFSCVNYCHGEGVVIRGVSVDSVHFSVAPGPGQLFIVVTDFEDAGRTGEQKDLREKLHSELPEDGTSQYCLEKVDSWSCGVVLYYLLCQERVSTGSAIDFTSEKWAHISRTGKSLAAGLLQKSVSQRMCSIEALNHPWILHNVGKPQRTSMKKAVSTLTSAKEKTEIKQLVVKFMIREVVKSEQLATLTECFQEFDTDYDGYITREELLAALQTTMRDDKARHETAKILKLADSNIDGKIDYTEFLMSSVGEQNLVCLQNLKKAFSGLDKNDDGRISADELRAELGMQQHNSDLWKTMISGVDLSGDGMLDFEEFTKMMKKSVEGNRE